MKIRFNDLLNAVNAINRGKTESLNVAAYPDNYSHKCRMSADNAVARDMYFTTIKIEKNYDGEITVHIPENIKEQGE